MTKVIVRGCSGFGDAIYLRAIVEWLLKNRGEVQYTVATNFPTIYEGLDVKAEPYFGETPNIDCNYTHRKEYGDTNQFQDMCINGGLPYIEYTSELKKRDPKGFVIALPLYSPMGGSPESSPMMPFYREYFDLIRKHENVLQIQSFHSFENLVKLFNEAELVICQQGWGTALAELLDVPAKVVFTQRGLDSKNKFIGSITPNKILTKSTSEAVILS